MSLDMHALWLEGMPIKPLRRERTGRTQCQLHHNEDHGVIRPLYLVEHFVFPQPLQVLCFGEVKDKRTILTCPTGADNVLTMIEWVSSANPAPEHWNGKIPWTHRPAVVHPIELEYAEKGLERYFAAREGLRHLRANGPWAVHPNDWRCPGCGGGMTLSSAGGRVTWSHYCPEGSNRLDLEKHHEVVPAWVEDGI